MNRCGFVCRSLALAALARIAMALTKGVMPGREIEAIMGGNYLRVLRQAQAT